MENNKSTSVKLYHMPLSRYPNDLQIFDCTECPECPECPYLSNLSLIFTLFVFIRDSHYLYLTHTQKKLSTYTIFFHLLYQSYVPLVDKKRKENHMYCLLITTFMVLLTLLNHQKMICVLRRILLIITVLIRNIFEKIIVIK